MMFRSIAQTVVGVITFFVLLGAGTPNPDFLGPGSKVAIISGYREHPAAVWGLGGLAFGLLYWPRTRFTRLADVLLAGGAFFVLGLFAVACLTTVGPKVLAATFDLLEAAVVRWPWILAVPALGLGRLVAAAKIG